MKELLVVRYLLHHLADEQLESGLRYVVSSILMDVGSSEPKDAKVVITQLLHFQVEGRL